MVSVFRVGGTKIQSEYVHIGWVGERGSCESMGFLQKKKKKKERENLD